MANYYVTVAGAGDNSGDSWANAMTQTELEALLEATVAAGDNIYVAGGTYTWVTDLYASRNGTAANKISIIGVASGTTAEPPTPSDWATGTARPLFDSNNVGQDLRFGGTYFELKNFRFTGQDSNTLVGLGSYAIVSNCSFQNSYNSPAAIGFTVPPYSFCYDCEFVSTYGVAVTCGAFSILNYSYIHDSVNGMVVADYVRINNVIIDTCSTSGIALTTDYNLFLNHMVLYNCTSGITMSGNCQNTIILNSTISNCTDALKADYAGTVQYYFGDYNNWYNNTRDMSWDNGSTEDNSAKGPNDLAVNPNFTDAGNGDFSLASGSGLVDAGFGIQLGVS